METAVGYPCDVLLKAQFTVKVYTKVANNFPLIDDVTTDRQTEVEPEILLRLARLPNQTISVFAAFNWSFRDAHQLLMSVTHADRRPVIALVSETLSDLDNYLSSAY